MVITTSKDGYRGGDEIMKSCGWMMMTAKASAASATTGGFGRKLMTGLQIETRLPKNGTNLLHQFQFGGGTNSQ